MTIDLNKPFTTQDVANLISSKNDDEHRQLRVTTTGTAFLSDDVGNRNLVGIAFRLETWDRGNGYVGKKAAADQGWVGRIEAALRKNWPIPSSTYIDHF